MALWVVLVFVTAVTCQGRDFDMSSCRLSCGKSTTDVSSGDSNHVIGLPGKRGEPGIKGERGIKGSKGDSGYNNNEFPYTRRQKSALAPSKKCHQTKFLFPAIYQVTDYIRMKTPIPEMSELTLCTWLDPVLTIVLNRCGFVSYATTRGPDTFTLFFVDNAQLDVLLNNEEKIISIPAITSRTHLCVAVNRKLGWAKIYTNGIRRGTLTYTDRNPIFGGGAFLIGQEQDAFFGGLNSGESFTGTIENFTIWYRVLSDTEISNIHRDPCSCPTDYAMSLSSDEIQLEGKVVAEPTAEC